MTAAKGTIRIPGLPPNDRRAYNAILFTFGFSNDCRRLSRYTIDTDVLIDATGGNGAEERSPSYQQKLC